MGLEPAELARWSRFAAKGGIGKCTATCDCVAESKDDLMFLKGDEITVLLQFHDKEGQYLGYCEGVVGRFSGTHVVFHSRLKKAVMTKRGSTHSTLSVAQSTSNLSNSPTPATPTTPTVDGSTPPSSRPSSSRRTPGSDDMLLIKGDARSQSQSPLGHISANPNTNLRSMTQDIRKSGGIQSTPPRDFHFATSVTHIGESTSGTTVNCASDLSLISHSSSLVDDPNISTHTLASSNTLFSTSIHVTSPSNHQLSTPTTKQDILRVPGSAEKDHEDKSATAPLRITKYMPSNPDSPLRTSTFQTSPSSTPRIQPAIVDTPDFVRSNATTLSENPGTNSCLSTSPIKDDKVPPSLDLSLQPGNIFSDIGNSNQDATPQSPAPLSALDTSATADSTFDDLTSSHPGRFSRFSIGPALSVSALLDMTAPKPLHSVPLKEGESGHVQKPVSVTPSNRHMVGRASISIAARGKVDEATLASTQAQVGIGLSLLQDLVGGMDSDSESESDHEESDNERISRLKETGSKRDGEGHGYIVGAAKSVRGSWSTEESTIEELMYASGEDVDHQQMGVVTHNEASRTTTKSSPMAMTESYRTPTSPTIPKVPQSPSQSAPGHRQPHESDLLTRERRPSLAPSSVSGKSGTSGSWDGDIYDNYRYSNFSMRSVAGRPSMDSVRIRTDSVNGRMKSESITEEKNFADEMESAVNSSASLKKTNRSAMLTDTGSLPRFSTSVDFNDSIYSQDSGLSSLSRDIAAINLPGHDSLTVNRPPPLSIMDHSPLLHTNWASPEPSTSGVQTALPPFMSGVYTPDPGRFDSEGDAQVGISLPTKSKDDGGRVEENPSGLTGMASAMRLRLETERQSPLPKETHDEEERNDISASLGLGDGIVVQDEEELPSRILSDGSDHGESDDVDVFSESHEGSVKGNILDLPLEPSNTMKGEKQEDGQSRHSMVNTRPPSPTSSNGGGECPELQSNVVLPYQSRVSMELIQSPPMPLSRRKPSIDTRQLRQRNTPSVGPEGRRSLFLPHPNAPKAPACAPLNVEPGAGIGAVSQAYRRSFVGQGSSSVSGNESIQQGNNLPPQPRTPVQAVIHMALSMGPRIMPPTPGRSPTRVLPTIYGRTEIELSTSIGPVPIVFSVDPPPITTGTKATAPKGAALPPIGAGGSAGTQDRTRPTSPPSHQVSPPRQRTTMVTQSSPAPSLSSFPSSAIKSAIRPATSPGTVTLSPTASNSEKKDNMENTEDTSKSTKGSPIPRPNFIPKAPGIRPRSRSFSGFNSGGSHDKPSSNLNLEEKQEFNKIWPKRNISSAISSVVLSSGPRNAIKSSPLRPSPLSISSVSGNTSVVAKTPPANIMRGSTPTSPLAHNVSALSISASPPSTVLNPNNTREQGQRAQSTSSSQPPILSTGFAQRSTLGQKGSGSLVIDGASVSTAGPINDVQVPSTKTMASLVSSDQPYSFPGPIAGKTPMKNKGPITSDGPSIDRQASLRTKLSLPNLRKNRNRDDDTIGVYDRDLRNAGGKLFDGQRSSLQGKARPKEVVQVKDMEFELVRPSLSVQQRSSEDSLIVRHESSFEFRSDGLLQPASPTISFSSSDLRSPILESYPSAHPSNLETSMGQASEMIEAHRQRELKWVSLVSSPASLSRKSKKVKKLLVEGVPSSVRYLIWSYLTDGKGRAVKGVYEQLCQRGEVTRTRDIAADAERLFGAPDGEAENSGTQYLHATKGAVVMLLQAYFSMVPDVRYSTGLTKIVGQLLLLAPEEDAFWIFTSIMDTHLRPYFCIPAQIPSSVHSNSVFRSTQMEVDGALYSRALEAADAPLSKKLFVDLGILPGVICQAWFTSLFVGTLPLDYINRVWDVFLYEGIPFLLRAALSLTFICRQFLLAPTTNTENKALAALSRPPIQWLPPSPEAFLTMAMNVKLKDDDIRKQRVKMGEIVKRQTQVQQGTSVNGSGISLPRV